MIIELTNQQLATVIAALTCFVQTPSEDTEQTGVNAIAQRAGPALTNNAIVEMMHALDAGKMLPDFSAMVKVRADKDAAEEAGYEYYVAKARGEYEEDGRVEIDDEPVISSGEDGAYVMAWVWVDKPEQEEAADV